jgi:adenine phosphoribosyltransferase
MDYNGYIREVPDFPKAGILFKDLTTLWKDHEAFKSSIDELFAHCRDKKINKVMGAESRGFIIGAPLAYLLGAGFIPARKPMKLPAETISASYALEYGEAAIEVHRDSISAGDNVVIVDDLLATGGTTGAMIKLTEQLGGRIVECLFLIELGELNGRKNIKYPVFSLIRS